MSKDAPADGTPIACYCNNVSVDAVRKAISQGAQSISSIYDCTGAGTGPCGGSCRVTLNGLIREASPKGSDVTLVTPPAELVRAVSLFNRRYYWETHEVLEHVWMDEHGKARLFYQGLIQAAAALYHVLNANPQGVLRLAEEAQRKLKAYMPVYLGVELDTLMKALAHFVQQARDIMGNTRAGFDYDALPHIEIGEIEATP